MNPKVLSTGCLTLSVVIYVSSATADTIPREAKGDILLLLMWAAAESFLDAPANSAAAARHSSNARQPHSWPRRAAKALSWN